MLLARVTRIAVVLALVGAAFVLAAPPAGATASLDSSSITCRNFRAEGSTTAPYYVVEVFDDIAGVDLLWEAYPTPEDGTFSFDVTWEPVDEGTTLRYFVWGSPTNDPEDYDGESYFSGTVDCTTPPEVLYGPLTVSGTATCEADGSQSIAWTAAHPLTTLPDGITSLPIVVDSAETTGAVEAAVGLSPPSLEPGDSAAATTTAGNGVTGTVTLEVAAHYEESDQFTSTGSVNLDGCLVATTPPPAPVAAPAPTPAPAVISGPRFTG